MNWILAVGGLVSLGLILSGLYIWKVMSTTPRPEPVLIPRDDQPQ